MTNELKILILEDDAIDARLIVQELNRAQLGYTSKVVMTEQDFLAGLEYYRPDIILADYKLPRFDGMAALGVAQKKCPDVPFIFVSGVMGEELAVEALKSGATDYVIKDKLGRLTPAMLRALREVQERNERRRSELIREALYQISEVTGTAADMGKFYAAIHAIIRTLTTVDNLYIAICRPGTELLTFPYFSDEKDPPPPDRPLGRGLTDYVIRTGKMVLTSRENFARQFPGGEVEMRGTQAVDWLGMPLKSGDQTFGALVIQSYDERYRLGEPELHIMGFVTQHVASALERKQAMELLRENELKHRTLLDSIKAPILSVREDMTINYCNQAYADLLGKSTRELEGRNMVQLSPAFKGSELHQAFAQALATDQAQLLEMQHDDRFIHYRVFRTPWGILSIAEDTTERRRMEEQLERAKLELEEKVQLRTQELAEANEALRIENTEREWTEQALRKSEEKYKFLYEESPTINIIIEMNGTVQDINKAALERLGYAKDEVVGKPILKFVAFDQRDKVMADLEKNFRGEATPELDVDIHAKDGSLHTILFSQKNVMIFEEGQPASILVSGIDITDRTVYEETRKKYEFITSASKDLMTLIRNDFVYEAANEAYCSAHQKLREEIVGRTVEEVWGREAFAVIGEYLGLCFKGEEVHYQKWFDFAALGHRFFDVAYYPYRDPHGAVTHVVVVSRDRTEYKLAEDQVAESQRTLSTLLANLPGMAYRCLVDRKRTMELVSQGCADLTGYNPAALVMNAATSFAEIIYPDDRDMVLAEVQNSTIQRLPFQLIYRIRDAAGEEKWVWEQGRGVYDENGQTLACEGFIVDITERKQLERALWEKEEHYRTLYENMPIGVYRTDPEGRILMANPYLVGMMGYGSVQELQAVNLERQNVYGPSYSRSQFVQAMERDGMVRAQEAEWRKKDGTVIYVRENAIAIRDKGGKTTYYEGTVEDITEQRHARLLESALYRISEITNSSQDLQEFYRAIHGVISELMYARNFYIALLDQNTKLLTFPYFVDERDPRPVPKARGTSVTEYVITTGQPLLAFRDTLQNLEAAKLITCQGTPDCCWLGVPLKRGDQTFGALAVHSYVEAMSFDEKDKEVLTFVANQIALAIERKKVEEDLRRLVAAIEQTAECLMITDPPGVIQYVNPAFETVTGFARQEALGKEHGTILGDNFRTVFKRDIEELLSKGRAWHGQYTQVRKDGTEFEADATLSPVMSAGGAVANVVLAVRDVTESKRLRSIAEAVNTMENIGYVFSGIRHEIGNALTSIKMAIGILTKNLDTYPKETIIKVIDMAAKEVSRMEDLLKSLKNFSMYESLKPEKVQVNQFIGKVRMLAAEDFKKRGIAIEAELAPVEIETWADPRALQQVILNLLANAADALSGREGARIVLSTKRSNGSVAIAVSDNGCGITRDQQRNLFKPFYTSKPSGTGLGLVITKNIMVKMNGDIAIDSEKDRGTTVTLTIPITQLWI